MREIIDHCAKGAGGKASPQYAEQQNRVGSLHQVLVDDEMGHGTGNP
jgi:hypothetical protein